MKKSLYGERQPYEIWEESILGRRNKRHKGLQVGPDGSEDLTSAEAQWAEEVMGQGQCSSWSIQDPEAYRKTLGFIISREESPWRALSREVIVQAWVVEDSLWLSEE